MNDDIRTRIENRSYASPARALSAVKRSNLPPGEKRRLKGLAREWQTELDTPIVGGLPPAPSVVSPSPTVDTAGPSTPLDGADDPAELVTPRGRRRVNLNEFVRVRFTTEGIVALHACGRTVMRSEGVVRAGGLWEGPLWQLMLVIAKSEGAGAEPIERSEFELLEAVDGRHHPEQLSHWADDEGSIVGPLPGKPIQVRSPGDLISRATRRGDLNGEV